VEQGRFYDCQFKERISQAAISAALLRSPAAEPGDALLQLRFPELAPSEHAEELEAEDFAEDKAPLRVRLRVILGGSILLWALIIYAAWSIYKLI